MRLHSCSRSGVGTAGNSRNNGFRQRLFCARFCRAHLHASDGVILMRRLSLALGLLAACAATGASAETVNLTGTYRCIQMCRNGMLGAPTFVTQNGQAVNLTTETGEAYQAWPTGTRPTAASGSMRAERALSIRLMACAFSSTMVASGSATSAPRHPWCSAVRHWSTAGSFKGGQRRIAPCPPLAHTKANRLSRPCAEFGCWEGTYHNLPLQ